MEEENKEEMADPNTARSKSTSEQFEPESPGVPGAGGGLATEGASGRRVPSEESSLQPEGSHTVTCTFTVSLAVPVLAAKQNQKIPNPPDRQGQRIPADESGALLRTKRCYHVEYFLLPDDLVPRKLDLVVFGMVAKLFAERDSKTAPGTQSKRHEKKLTDGLTSSTIMPWFENDQMWISWNHSTDINVTNEYLIKLRDHKITLKLWDAKDKISSKARLSKPSIVSSLERDAEAVGGVKHTVLLQRKLFEESQPPPSCTKIKEAKKSKAQKESSALPVKEETDWDEAGASSYGLPHPSKIDDVLTVRGVIFAKDRSVDEAQLLTQKAVAEHPENIISEEAEKTTNNVGSLMYQADKIAIINGRRGSAAKEDVDATTAKKYDVASLQLDLMPLLSGEKSVISRLEENNPIVLDAYVTFTVETPLLSERQRHELNPLVIKIYSATCLPNTPVPIEVLQRLCVPTYCKYRFHNFPPHQTHGQIHGTHVYFKDVNVLLTGTMKPGELQRYLRGPPLEIEVHDRDRIMEDNTKMACLFGEDQADKKVGEVSLPACKSTIYNSFTESKVWHPHGVAKVSLTDLLLGKKFLAISAPIHSCSVPNTGAFNKEDKNEKITESVDTSLLPMGHYLQSDSLLKVRVEIAVPLGMHAEIADVQVTNCPYGYIIYVFGYSNSSLLHDLVEEITEINANALQLHSYPVHRIGMARAALILKTTLEKVSELDVLSGFHVLDGATHLFVLEGLKDKAIKRLWDRHFERTYRHEDGQLEILYNSQLSFSQRLYTDLEAIFYHFCLCMPLFTIVKQPLLYVRGMLPWACFQALSRLSYLCQCKRLRDVIHGDLLPSAEMITVLSQEYGVPLPDEDLFTRKPPVPLFSSDACILLGKLSREKKTVYSSLDNYNEKYVQWKKEMAEKMSPERNHIRANIGATRQLKGKMKKAKFEAFRIYPVDGKSVHNYSSQSLNSAELAKKYLRQEMAKEPKNRFTYCPEYLSATFDSVDVAAACKESFAKSKSMWLSPHGFVFPGFKSSIESNLHPRMPDEARLEELSQKWQANVLYANKEPVLSRDRWSWDKRHIDFDLYTKPPVTTAPLTDAIQVVQTAFDDTKLKVHRCSAAAELSTRGPRASCQLQKLQGLLKDEPRKFSLRKPGLILKPIPALSVLDNQPSQNIVAVLPGKRKSICYGFVPGPEGQHSLKWSKNFIPCHNRERKVFEKLKGADFNLFCYKHSLIYKRDQSARGRAAISAEQEDPLQNEMPEPAVTLDTATESQSWDDLTQN
uniref:Cilia and flagella associated protein 92 (putative) n=1 Tax=Cairina moschata TaxID=8855 RepID=A0A8C3B8B8_CAIMO